MTSRIVSVVLATLLLFALISFSEIRAQRQTSTPAVTRPLPSLGAPGRYQYVEGAVTRVFDTQTGRIYLWFPRNEQEKRDPYLFVEDPVAGTGTTIAIKFVDQN